MATNQIFSKACTYCMKRDFNKFNILCIFFTEEGASSGVKKEPDDYYEESVNKYWFVFAGGRTILLWQDYSSVAIYTEARS